MAAALTVPLAAERSSHEFDGHKFSLQLPSGYTLHGDASPSPGFKTFAFSTEPRDDGTRGLIQVSLVDLSKAPAGEVVGLDKLATTLIGSVRQRRSRWEQTETDVQIDGAHAKRIEWSGSMETGFGRPPVDMRGVMIVGIKKNLGFSLHTQDFVKFADATLPLCEQALQTFSVTLRR